MEEEEQDALALQRFNREKQEYLDARASYDAILGQVSSQMPVPYSMTSNYGIAQDGPQRASTDPWIREQHPDLAEAGARVVTEQQDFLALDEPISSFAEQRCSIASYTANKIYEYYAALEMVYKLATDEAFRQSVASHLHSAFNQSAFMNQQAADMLRWRAGHLEDDIEDAEAKERGDRTLMDKATSVFGFENAEEFYLWAQGYDSVDEWANDLPNGVVYAPQTAAELRQQRDLLLEQAQIHQDAAIAKLKNFFASIWADMKKRYAECGLMYAIITTGIDGAFLAAEFGTGLAVLRGLKFVRTITRAGKFKVQLRTIEGRDVGEAEWSPEQLANKYGEPEKTQVGGYEPDPNRDIPDVPAERAPPRTQTTPDAEADATPTPPRRIRTNEQLAPGGRVPTASSGEFNSWWNDLSADELDALWADKALKRQIAAQVREPGGLHEWLMVAEGPKLKRLGFDMDEIKAMTSPTRELEGPYPNGVDGERWRHSPEGGGRGSGAHSGEMHKTLRAEIEAATSRDDLLRRLGRWSQDWLQNGSDDFPDALRDAIRGVSNY